MNRLISMRREIRYCFMMLSLFTNTFIKFFFLLTPFFVMSTFLAMTRDMSSSERKRIAIRVMIAIIVTSAVVFAFGNYIFDIMGITLDAFRVGAGGLLFLSAVSLVYGRRVDDNVDPNHDIAVVPLAIPVTVGPAITGTLLVTAADAHNLGEKAASFAGIFLADVCIGLLLLMAVRVERVLGQRNMNVISKITGVVIAAISAQMILAGVKSFFHVG